MIFALFGGLLVSLAVRFLIEWSSTEGRLAAALVAGLFGLLLAASNSSLGLIFEGRPKSLILINAGHDVFSAAAVGFVLGFWR